jgi:hypothetical protein
VDPDPEMMADIANPKADGQRADVAPAPSYITKPAYPASRGGWRPSTGACTRCSCTLVLWSPYRPVHSHGGR